MKEIHITENTESGRLDKFLRRLLSQATGGFVYKMLRKKNITLNDKKATGSEILKSGDTIKIYFSDETYARLTTANETDINRYKVLKEADYGIDVIYEDEELIIINKPAGILSQKASADDVSINEMALSYLLHHGKLSCDDMSHFTPSVVNRLDMNTSGIILFAKTYTEAKKLSEQIRNNSIKKQYRCIVHGKCDLDGTYESYIKKDEKNNKVVIRDEPFSHSISIRTIFTPIKVLDDITYMQAELITGKSHQIRSQLAHKGFPILFDLKYGDRNKDKKYLKYYDGKGQLLCAYRVTLPQKGVYTAELPKGFFRILSK